MRNTLETDDHKSATHVGKPVSLCITEYRLWVKERKGSAIDTMHSLKALTHGSHSFTCKLHHAFLSSFLQRSPDGATPNW